MSEEEKDEKKAAPKRMPRGSIHLMFAGDLILAKTKQKELQGLFRRYEHLFESFANLEREQRRLAYKFLNALMLTSYAKKVETKAEKKELFEKKNQLFISIALDRSVRTKVSFRYLQSKNFNVTKFCDNCTNRNKKEGLEKAAWKHCKKCQVDRNFFNVVAMIHHYPKGSACLYLSNDQTEKLGPLKYKEHKGKLGDIKEEALLDRFHYNTQNLDAIELPSVLKMYDLLMAAAPSAAGKPKV